MRKKKYQRLEIDKNIYIIKNIPQNVFFFKNNPWISSIFQISHIIGTTQKTKLTQ